MGGVMADLTVKQHDTWPPLRGAASDANGLVDLSTADSIKLILKSGATVVGGAVEVIDPPDEDGMNWQYNWQTADVITAGTFSGELEVTWDEGTSPPEVQSFPNTGTISV